MGNPITPDIVKTKPETDIEKGNESERRRETIEKIKELAGERWAILKGKINGEYFEIRDFGVKISKLLESLTDINFDINGFAVDLSDELPLVERKRQNQDGLTEMSKLDGDQFINFDGLVDPIKGFLFDVDKQVLIEELRSAKKNIEQEYTHKHYKARMDFATNDPRSFPDPTFNSNKRRGELRFRLNDVNFCFRKGEFKAIIDFLQALPDGVKIKDTNDRRERVLPSFPDES